MAIIPGRQAGGGAMNPILGLGGGRADIIQGLLGQHPTMGGGPIVNAPGGGGQRAQVFGRGLNGHPFYNEQNWLHSLAHQIQMRGAPQSGPILRHPGDGSGGVEMHPGGGDSIPGVPNREGGGGLLEILQGLGSRGDGRPAPQAPRPPASFRQALIQRAMAGGGGGLGY